MNAVNKIFAALTAAGLIGLIGWSGLASQETAQNIDPFYLQRLESGERAFLAGDIDTAVKDLEIALFGLAGEKELRAKACLYLGLSHYSLKNTKKAEEYLRDAKNLLGMEGLKPLVSSEPVWSYLNRIMVEFRILDAEVGSREGAAVLPGNLEQRLSRDTGTVNFAAQLEQRIKSNPWNVSLYYELYEYHWKNGSTDAAKKTLENLIKRNPDEAKGYYLMGRVQYKQRDLKGAEKNLSKVFELQKKVPVEDYVLVEAMAYRILTVHLRGNRKTSARMFAEWADHFSEEKIRYLDLDEQERGIFMGIAQSEATLAEIERMRNQGVSGSGVGQESGQEQVQSLSVETAGDYTEQSSGLKTGDLVLLGQVDRPPELKKRVDPKYPASAKAMGIEGQVMVNVLISETGDVVEVVVVQGLRGGFDEATVTAVKQWKYEPAIKDGLKVKVWKPITITFRNRGQDTLAPIL